MKPTIIALYIVAMSLAENVFAAPNRCGGPVLAAPGSYQELVVPGANETMAAGINARGQIVGVHRVNSDGGHAFVYENGEFITFDYPGAATTRFDAINNAGTILGYQAGSHGDGIFLYRHGSATPLNFSVPGGGVYPVAINNLGTILLGANIEGVNSGRILTTTGEVTEVRFPGAADTIVTDISSSNVVGRARMADTNQYFSFMFSSGQYSLIEPCSYGLTPAMFVGSTMALAGSPWWPVLPAEGYVSFIERPNATYLLQYPGAEATFVTGVNSAGYAVGIIGAGRTFVYSPR
jgi:probable HAF family extracellular repeat protein